MQMLQMLKQKFKNMLASLKSKLLPKKVNLQLDKSPSDYAADSLPTSKRPKKVMKNKTVRKKQQKMSKK